MAYTKIVIALCAFVIMMQLLSIASGANALQCVTCIVMALTAILGQLTIRCILQDRP